MFLLLLAILIVLLYVSYYFYISVMSQDLQLQEAISDIESYWFNCKTQIPCIFVRLNDDKVIIAPDSDLPDCLSHALEQTFTESMFQNLQYAFLEKDYLIESVDYFSFRIYMPQNRVR